MTVTQFSHNVTRTISAGIYAACVVACLILAGQSQRAGADPFRITLAVDGLNDPWAIGFLPEGKILITERAGRLFLVEDGRKTEIDGVPAVYKRGQGGLLDILVPRGFAHSRLLFFTYAKRQAGGAGTAVARATFTPGSKRLEDWTEIYAMTPGSRGGRHFGSRLVEAADGTLFVTIGDRGDSTSAQDAMRSNGSVIRIDANGAPFSGNPFSGHTAYRPEIWSFGHRNAQGAALDLDGQLLTVEHGARGGDEINLIRKGQNYGWPVISYGRHYSGKKIGEGTHREGMEQPLFYWDPSIAPTGLMVYSGKLWPQWRGHIFTGSLKMDFIARLSGAPLRAQARIATPETVRVRDIREGPAGGIWFLSEGKGALYKITP